MDVRQFSCCTPNFPRIKMDWNGTARSIVSQSPWPRLCRKTAQHTILLQCHPSAVAAVHCHSSRPLSSKCLITPKWATSQPFLSKLHTLNNSELENLICGSARVKRRSFVRSVLQWLLRWHERHARYLLPFTHFPFPLPSPLPKCHW